MAHRVSFEVWLRHLAASAVVGPLRRGTPEANESWGRNRDSFFAPGQTTARGLEIEKGFPSLVSFFPLVI